ncbi:MAG: hypothetical protein OEY05_08460, partial [Paracoccaceae bacterium]|nr:hypothetical protein [Paracoccaceae bacterium]
LASSLQVIGMWKGRVFPGAGSTKGSPHCRDVSALAKEGLIPLTQYSTPSGRKNETSLRITP